MFHTTMDDSRLVQLFSLCSSRSLSTVTMSKGGRSWSSIKISALVVLPVQCYQVLEGSCCWPYICAVQQYIACIDMCIVYSYNNKLEKVFTNLLTLDGLLFSSAAQLWYTETIKQTNKNTWNTNKDVLFTDNQLYWIDQLKKNGNRLYPYTPQPVQWPFTIYNHTHQYCTGFKIAECLCNHTKKITAQYWCVV